MGLEAIKGVGPATVKKLNKVGVRTLDDMRTIDVATVAEKTGIAEDRLGVWKKEAQLTKVLDDIKGVGPAVKKKLHSAGIHSVDDLVRATVHEVAEKTQFAEARVKAWKKEADAYARKAATEVKPRAQAAARTTKKVARGVGTQARTVAKDAKARAEAVAHEVEQRIDTARHGGTNGTATTKERHNRQGGPTAATTTVETSSGNLLTRLKVLFTGKR